MLTCPECGHTDSPEVFSITVFRPLSLRVLLWKMVWPSLLCCVASLILTILFRDFGAFVGVLIVLPSALWIPIRRLRVANRDQMKYPRRRRRMAVTAVIAILINLVLVACFIYTELGTIGWFD